MAFAAIAFGFIGWAAIGSVTWAVAASATCAVAATATGVAASTGTWVKMTFEGGSFSITLFTAKVENESFAIC
jgi:hypothetical protein